MLEDVANVAVSEDEVTPDMIKAGLRELALFEPAEDPPEYWEECVAGIYRAMHLVRER